MRAAQTWVVAYLHNTNGMAAWCLEAAQALSAAGEQVILACAPRACVPPDIAARVIRCAARPAVELPRGRIRAEMGRLSRRPLGIVGQLDMQLRAEGSQGHTFLLSQSDLYDPRVITRQLVVAWAKGTALVDYLLRLRHHVRGTAPAGAARHLLDAIGWWRRDWAAYRGATEVLAVTHALKAELRSRGVAARAVHPCVNVSQLPPMRPSGGAPRVLAAAVRLDEPRKRIGWMLAALAHARINAPFSLTLAGSASPVLVRQANSLGVPVTWTGALPREDIARKMREHDVFIFGSVLDDWGYVLAEAMSYGMAIVAPRLSPFDEMVGEAGALYESDSPSSFAAAFHAVLAAGPAGLGNAAWIRARQLFSRERFTQQLVG